jgi:hypothetical protein
MTSIFGCGPRVLEIQRILSGTGAQQTQTFQFAETVEVVRNHEDGPGDAGGTASHEPKRWNSWRAGAAESMSDAGRFTQTNSTTGG